MLNKRIYYVSNIDNEIHNINDVQHQIVSEREAYIGKDCGEDGFRVDEEVNLWKFEEITNILMNV